MQFSTGLDTKSYILPITTGGGVKKCFRKFFSLKKVYAEKSNDGGAGKNKENEEKAPPLNFEDLVVKARKEEKDKLYPQINELKEKNKVLTEKNNEYLLTIAGLEQKVKDSTAQAAQAGKGDPQEVIDLKQKLKDALEASQKLQKKVEEFKPVDEVELRKTIETEIKESYEVKFYKIQKIQEAGDDLLLPELVIGETKEEIDNSLATAIVRSNELKEKLGVKLEQKDKKTSKKPSNPTNPPDKGGKDKYTDIDYIVSLDPTSVEYKEWRKKAGLK